MSRRDDGIPHTVQRNAPAVLTTIRISVKVDELLRNLMAGQRRETQEPEQSQTQMHVGISRDPAPRGRMDMREDLGDPCFYDFATVPHHYSQQQRHGQTSKMCEYVRQQPVPKSGAEKIRRQPKIHDLSSAPPSIHLPSSSAIQLACAATERESERTHHNRKSTQAPSRHQATRVPAAIALPLARSSRSSMPHNLRELVHWLRSASPPAHPRARSRGCESPAPLALSSPATTNERMTPTIDGTRCNVDRRERRWEIQELDISDECTLILRQQEKDRADFDSFVFSLIMK